ncbi:hypothetical protein TNCV_3173841 [Trichonephila clavipes]|nr:hypothetical protein TNCV_3173841 [Trichonephila clavipes]
MMNFMGLDLAFADQKDKCKATFGRASSNLINRVYHENKSVCKRDLRVLDAFLGGGFFLRGFEVCFASWHVAGMVLDVVEVSRTELVSAGISKNNGQVAEESALLDEDAVEVDELLYVAGVVSIKEIGG